MTKTLNYKKIVADTGYQSEENYPFLFLIKFEEICYNNHVSICITAESNRYKIVVIYNKRGCEKYEEYRSTFSTVDPYCAQSV